MFPSPTCPGESTTLAVRGAFGNGGGVPRLPARRRIARGRLASVAAFPTRLAVVARHNGRLASESARWLVRSREHTNFTYDLTRRNRDHLAWWVANLTGAPVAEIRGYIEELDVDEELRGHIERATRASERWRLADSEVRYGRRAGWYAVVRALRPRLVIETGTDKGLGSCVLAAALLRNGDGRVITMDVNPESGYLVTGRYAEVVDRQVGDSIQLLRAVEDPVGLFLHDSWHTYEHETNELDAVEDRLSDGLALSDNAHGSDALLDWAERNGRCFTFFREEPAEHWYPGEGIGAAHVDDSRSR